MILRKDQCIRLHGLKFYVDRVTLQRQRMAEQEHYEGWFWSQTYTCISLWFWSLADKEKKSGPSDQAEKSMFGRSAFIFFVFESLF